MGLSEFYATTLVTVSTRSDKSLVVSQAYRWQEHKANDLIFDKSKRPVNQIYVKTAQAALTVMNSIIVRHELSACTVHAQWHGSNHLMEGHCQRLVKSFVSRKRKLIITQKKNDKSNNWKEPVKLSGQYHNKCRVTEIIYKSLENGKEMTYFLTKYWNSDFSSRY